MQNLRKRAHEVNSNHSNQVDNEIEIEKTFPIAMSDDVTLLPSSAIKSKDAATPKSLLWTLKRAIAKLDGQEEIIDQVIALKQFQI